jgi:glutathione S-transferase
MFLAEKGVTGIENVTVSIAGNEHRSPAYLAKSPQGKVPALELADGRVLTETRAICTYLEGLYPEPNLMGLGFEERAFIEMTDRRIEFYLMGSIANCIRHTHPGLAALEQPQFPAFGQSQGEKMRGVARWLDGELARQPYVAGPRFTVADITAFVALEFARGLMKFSPGEEGMPHLQAYRDRWLDRASAAVQ